MNEPSCEQVGSNAIPAAKTGLVRRRLVSFAKSVRYCLAPAGLNEAEAARVTVPMITIWGLLYGLILSGVFAYGWKFFGDIYFTEYSRLRIVPTVLVILVSSLLDFRQLQGLAIVADRVTGDADGSAPLPMARPVGLAGQLALLLAVLLKFSALLAMPYPTPWWPGDRRRYFKALYPIMYYRVLILMGLWGKTGLLVAAATGPTRRDAAEGDRALRRGLTIKALLGNLAFTFVLTTVYFSQWWNRALGLLVAFVVFLLVYLLSIILAWRLKGHDRFSMFACAEVSEILLLFGYLAIARYLQ